MKKKKTIIKNNIFGFILGGLIFGTVGVYAATYCASSDVSYDNSKSGLNSTDVQSAIDEIYEITQEKSPLKGIPVVTSGDGLYKDQYEEGRYFFKGGNVNNYIIFNNETWRILSIEADGSLKIMRNENFGRMEWSLNNSSNWNTSSLKNYLNTTFLNSVTVNRDKIVSHTWSIGEIEYENNDLSVQIINENETKTQLIQVGLITASEILRTNSNINQCSTWYLNYNNSEECKATSWITNSVITKPPITGGGLWTISQSSNSSAIFFGTRMVQHAFTNDNDFYPVIYLNSNTILKGDGSIDNMFTIE